MLPPGCHGNPPYTGPDGTRRNGTGTVTLEKDCKSAPHHGFFFSFPQVQSLSRLLVTPRFCWNFLSRSLLRCHDHEPEPHFEQLFHTDFSSAVKRH